MSSGKTFGETFNRTGYRDRQRNGTPLDGSQVFATRVGLCFPKIMEYQSWERAGHQLTRVVDSSAWCLGDWVVYGESHYAERYRHAIDATGLDYAFRCHAGVTR
jgi:hypothetical protein